MAYIKMKPSFNMKMLNTSDQSKGPARVVVIGGGFGGLTVAQGLKDPRVSVTIIDRTNHHLFQPLLYQVATAGLSPADIAKPIRSILKKRKNVRTIMGEVESVDTDAKIVRTTDREFEYDKLVIAAGARHSYFGNHKWEKYAPGLKSLDDALDLRRRILTSFEVAENASDHEARVQALTFVVIGAGPTGVEMAGAIAELARFTLTEEFSEIDPGEAKVILLEGGPRVLPMFHQTSSAQAAVHLKELGVDVRLNAIVTSVNENSVVVGGETIHTRTIVWAAGNEGSPLGRMLGLECDRAGRVYVQKDLTVPDHEDIYVIGDMAHFEGDDGRLLPGVSPVAIQQGKLVARNIERSLDHRNPLPFSYVDKGSMATIGRHAAVAEIAGVKFGGFTAWLGWLFVHLIFLVGFRNRVAVFLQWAYAYFTYGRGARLISSTKKTQPEPVTL